jgi:hypothetical protein
MLNIVEQYYIYKETSLHNQIDFHTVLPNAIFEAVLNHIDATWPNQFHAIRPTKPATYTTDGLPIHHYSIQRIRITPPPGNEHNILLQSTIKQQMETWYIRLLMTTSSLPTIYIGHHQPHVSSQRRRSILTWTPTDSIYTQCKHWEEPYQQTKLKYFNSRHLYLTDCPATQPCYIHQTNSEY